MLAAPLQRGVVELETGRGIVPVELERDESGAIVFGRMEQPIPSVEPFADTGGAACGRWESTPPSVPSSTYDNGPRFTFVVLGSPEEVAALRPDLRRSRRSGSRSAASPARA